MLENLQACFQAFFVETLRATKKKEGDCPPSSIFFVTIYEIADNTQNLFPSFYAALHFWVNFYSVYGNLQLKYFCRTRVKLLVNKKKFA